MDQSKVKVTMIVIAAAAAAAVPKKPKQSRLQHRLYKRQLLPRRKKTPLHKQRKQKVNQHQRQL